MICRYFCKNGFQFILLWFIYSCEQYDKVDGEYHYKDYLVDQIELSLDDSTSNEFYYIQYVEEGGRDYMVSLNTLIQSIDKYSLSVPFEMQRIYLPQDESLKLPQVYQGLTYHNKDSIFVYPKGNINGGVLINSIGEIVDRLSHQSFDTEAYNLINHASVVPNPTILIEGELHFMRYPLFDTYDPNNINDKYPLPFKYNLKEKKGVFDSTITFPDFYQNKIWSITDIIYSRTILSDNNYVISWPLLDYLIHFNSLNGTMEKVPARSGFQKETITPFSVRPEGIIASQQVLEKLRYRNVVFDPYKNLIYRFCFLPLTDTKNKSYIPHKFEQKFSVIVMDKDFKILKEVVFPGNNYSSSTPIVGRKGLMLLRNNPFDPDLSEDSLLIDVFDLSKVVE